MSGLAFVVGLCFVGHSSQDPDLTHVRQSHWQAHVDSGILAQSYMDRIDCVGHPWNELRARVAEQTETGNWDLGLGDAREYEERWAALHETWPLIKAAEEIMEIWRRVDLGVKSGGTVEETLQTMQRSITENTVAVVDVAMAATIMSSHLEQISGADRNPNGLAASCFPGFLAAMVVFGRALAVLGASKPVTDGEPDGFLLWRQEHGYLLEELFLGEGASIVDLFQAPGWPAVSASFVEQVLHVPSEDDVEANVSPGNEPDALVKLGGTRQFIQPRPQRLPIPQRYHRAADPNGASSWGRMAATWMSQREDAVQAALAINRLPPWNRVGRAWIVHEELALDIAFRPERPVRLLALVSQHGALDLEMPELLLSLFPKQLDGKFLLTGFNQRAICKKSEGSLTMARLCENFLQEHGGQMPPEAPGLKSPPSGGREKLFDERVVPDVEEVRIFSAEVDASEGHAAAQAKRLPDMLMLSSFVEAIWARRTFPKIPLFVYFGPPLLLDVGMDMEGEDKNGRGQRGPVAEEFWAGIRELMKCTMDGFCMIAAESLFRSEQFFYQTGVEVPFLRPMSVWVNATYNPRPRKHGSSDQVARHEVLLHSRGRLKYEVHFVKALKNLAGPAFPYRVASQDGKIIPFAELATYLAVVIIPWSPEICMLRHLFKMRVPLFVPDRGLLRNLVHVSNRRLMPYPYHLSMPGTDRQEIQAVHPYDPFWDTIRRPADARGIEARIYWTEYSEYLLLPMLQYFTSAASLMVGLHTLDGQKVSARMRKVYLEDMEEMRSFWITCLTRTDRKSVV